jgi:hypothetical protein
VASKHARAATASGAAFPFVQHRPN